MSSAFSFPASYHPIANPESRPALISIRNERRRVSLHRWRFTRLIPGVIVNHPTSTWLLGRRKEPERIAERHVVGVNVVPSSECLVGDEKEKRVNPIIAWAPPVREARAGIVSSTGASVWH